MNDEHPHRCRAGHQWHHAGPSASGCRLLTGHTESGEPFYIGTDECPLCSGRSELLVQEAHEHQCPVCVGTWRHEGVCVEGPMAWCPWCIPASGAPPAPGSRCGRHFHVCPRCARSWAHAHPCAGPLRAQTADCPGCRRARWSVRAARIAVPLSVAACLALGLSLGLRPGFREPERPQAEDRAPQVRVAATPDALTLRGADGSTPSRGIDAGPGSARVASAAQRKSRGISAEPAARRTAPGAPSRTSGSAGFAPLVAPLVAVLDTARARLATLMPAAGQYREAHGFTDAPASER